jgi:hypothetical protein
VVIMAHSPLRKCLSASLRRPKFLKKIGFVPGGEHGHMLDLGQPVEGQFPFAAGHRNTGQGADVVDVNPRRPGCRVGALFSRVLKLVGGLLNLHPRFRRAFGVQPRLPEGIAVVEENRGRVGHRQGKETTFLVRGSRAKIGRNRLRLEGFLSLLHDFVQRFECRLACNGLEHVLAPDQVEDGRLLTFGQTNKLDCHRRLTGVETLDQFPQIFLAHAAQLVREGNFRSGCGSLGLCPGGLGGLGGCPEGGKGHGRTEGAGENRQRQVPLGHGDSG